MADNDDLFANVRLPKEDRRRPAAPHTQAAPAPPAAPSRPETKPSGVPLTRLLGWAAPLLAVVAVVVLWSISFWLVIVAAAAAALTGIGALIVRAWRRRRGVHHRAPGRNGQLTARSSGLSGTGRTTARPGLFGRNRHRNGTGTGTPAKAGSGSSGGKPGRGSRLGALLGRGGKDRQTAASGPATGRGRASAGNGRQAAGGKTPGRLGRLLPASMRRRSGTPAGGSPGNRRSGTDGASSTSKPSRFGLGRSTRPAHSKPGTGILGRRRGGGTGTTGGNSTRSKNGRGKHDTTSTGRRRSSSLPRAAVIATALMRGRRGADKTKTTEKTGSKTNPDEGKKPESDQDKQPKKSGPKEKFIYDDAGFPSPNLYPAPKPKSTATTAPKTEPAPPSRPVFDEGDAFGYTPPPPRKTKTQNATDTKGTTVMTTSNTAQEIDNPYIDMVDNSTKETKAATMRQAADAARADATRLDEEADNYRSRAKALENQHMHDAASALYAEAARLAEDAERRRMIAAAFDTAAV